MGEVRIDRAGANRTEALAEAAQELAVHLVPRRAERAEQLGEIFLACESVAREQPEAFERALGEGSLVRFLLPRVRLRLVPERAQRFRGGWMGTYVGPDGRDVDGAQLDELARTDAGQLELARRALQRALSQAIAAANEILVRNLRWYEQRLARQSYAAIARAEGKPAGTIRTGVARARRHVLRTVHELRHAQPAPLNGEAPPQIEPLRQLWFAQDLDALERGLERTRDAFRNDPHWLNLAALLRADRGERDRAMALYERALVFADAPGIRARLLNNLGNLSDDLGRAEDACHYWLRAHQLLPDAPAPLLNLLAAASLRHDYASAQLYIAEVGERLSAARFCDEDRHYVLRRLADNPKLAWLRETDAWRNGPARWLRQAGEGSSRLSEGVRRIAATAVAFALSVLPPGLSLALTSDASEPSRAERRVDPTPLVQHSGQGGDSMGSPRGRRD